MPPQKKVLVIDDEPDLLNVVKVRLEFEHFECLTALTPVEGLKLAEEQHPNLILLDLDLPQMSGFGFLREIKHGDRTASIPVVVLTANGTEEIAREALSLGAVAFLTKSCQAQTLSQTVHSYTD